MILRIGAYLVRVVTPGRVGRTRSRSRRRRRRRSRSRRRSRRRRRRSSSPSSSSRGAMEAEAADGKKIRASRAMDALMRGTLRERLPASAESAVAHFTPAASASGATTTDGGARAGGATATAKAKAKAKRARAPDGNECIAPRALVCVFETPREGGEREDEESSESESEGRRETVAGLAYGARVRVVRWTMEEEATKEEDEESEEEDDGTMDSDSEDAYGGYASSSSEDMVRRMKRLRTRPMGTCEEIALTDDDTPHVDHIRVFRTSADGKWFVTAGDDKMIKLWSVDGWRCARTVTCSKKISAACFTPDSKHFIFADKFGEVHACEIGSTADPVLMLGHCSAIIADCECGDGGDRGYLFTADREHKTRVSVLPKPEDRTRFHGSAPEIQSFCYGHTAYVSCVRAIDQPASTKKTWQLTKDVFVTGSGDSTVRMWDATTGKETDLRATIYLHYGEICDIATRREGTHVSVAIEGKKELAVVHLTAFQGVPKLFMVGFGPPWDEAPHSIRFDRDMILWGAGVRENDDGSRTAVFMREGNVVDGLSVTLSAEESAGTTLYTQLRKRDISDAERMERKKQRKDVQLKAQKEESKQ